MLSEADSLKRDPSKKRSKSFVILIRVVFPTLEVIQDLFMNIILNNIYVEM